MNTSMQSCMPCIQDILTVLKEGVNGCSASYCSIPLFLFALICSQPHWTNSYVSIRAPLFPKSTCLLSTHTSQSLFPLRPVELPCDLLVLYVHVVSAHDERVCSFIHSGRQAWLVLLHFNQVRHPRWHGRTATLLGSIRDLIYSCIHCLQEVEAVMSGLDFIHDPEYPIPRPVYK